MQSIFDKRDFYSAMLRGRLPVAEAIFVFGGDGGGRLEFFCTPIGTVLCAHLNNDLNLREIKMYDRSGGNFEIQNVFCGDNLLRIDDNTFMGISGKLQIEDIIGRNFLIKTDSISIIATARAIEKTIVDKRQRLVYN